MEALQLLGGAVKGAVLAGDIYLGDLLAGDQGSIGHGKADLVALNFQPGVGKVGIAFAVAEAPAHLYLGGVVIAVACVQALPVLSSLALAGIVAVAGGILQGQGPAFRQLAAGVYLARQGVSHSACPGLTAKIAVDDGPAGAGGDHKRRTAGEHQHQVGLFLTEAQEQALLGGRQL